MLKKEGFDIYSVVFVMSIVVAVLFSFQQDITGRAVIQQAITITTPIGGENFTAGENFFISWTSSGVSHYQITYSVNASASCAIFDGGTCTTGDGNWICLQDHPYSPLSLNTSAPQLNSTTVRIRVEGHSGVHSTLTNNCSEIFTIASLPAIPRNLSGEVINSTAINLSWISQFSNELVDKYLIFRDGVGIANTTDNNTLDYLDTNLTPSTSYNYSLKSSNPIGESDFTENFTVTTAAEPGVVTLNSPVDALNTSSNTVTFNCSVTSNVGLVNISLFHNTTGNFSLNQTVNISGLSNSSIFVLENLSDGSYVWNCQAFDVLGNSNFAASNKTFTIDNIPPGIITNLTAKEITASNITWNWTNPPDSDLSYMEIYRDGIFIANVPAPANEYNLQGLAASTPYTLSVRTVDAVGNINSTFVNATETTLSSEGGGGGGGNGDLSISISGPGGDFDHEGMCYTTDSSDTCPSSGTGTIGPYCETYGWTEMWRHINKPGSYSCTIGDSDCIPSVTTSTMRVSVEAHNPSHSFIGFDCSSSFSVSNSNFGKTLTVTWTDSGEEEPSPGGGGGGGGGGGAAAVVSCTEAWSCSSWTECVNGKQTRTCTDANVCNTTKLKPSESQGCKVVEKLPEKVEVPMPKEVFVKGTMIWLVGIIVSIIAIVAITIIVFIKFKKLEKIH